MKLALLFLLVLAVPATPAAEEALKEVNAARRRHGLQPYRYSKSLTAAAKRCADYRAARLMAGHTHNDFVVGRVNAPAAGCAAWKPSLGWGACCTYDREYRHAGAAWAKGRDGRRYMHLFVRH